MQISDPSKLPTTEKSATMSHGALPTATIESVILSEPALASVESTLVPAPMDQPVVATQVDSGGAACPIPMHVHMQLDPNYPKIEKIGWWILTSIIGGILMVVWLVVGIAIRGQIDFIQWIWLFGIAVVIWLGILASWFFPRRTFETTCWQLKENGIEIRRGIWWRHRIFVPHDRIQHTDVSQGPIDRMYGIATLVINTGGTHEPSIPLGGLNLAMAEQLRALLSKSTSSL